MGGRTFWATPSNSTVLVVVDGAHWYNSVFVLLTREPRTAMMREISDNTCWEV